MAVLLQIYCFIDTPHLFTIDVGACNGSDKKYNVPNHFKLHSFHTKIYIFSQITRMHSSRMRTVRCSGRLLGGVCLGGVCPRGFCLLPGGVSSQEDVCPGGCLPSVWGVYTSSPLWTDRHL